MICQHCQTEFTPKVSKQKYCSKACNVNSWVASHRERSYEIKQKYRLAHPDQYAEYAAKYHKNNPESPDKKAARHAVEHGIRAGNIVRPNICEYCQKTDYTEAHHYKGYEPKHRLDVVWLCVKCHAKADRV